MSVQHKQTRPFFRYYTPQVRIGVRDKGQRAARRWEDDKE
jgi:hypothetical protein